MTPRERTREAIEALLRAIDDMRPQTPAVRALQRLADVIAAQFHADFKGEQK
jgi:hypothetical protein